MLDYGLCFAKGEGVDKDLVSAASYYKMAADLGNVVAMVNSGVCLELGEGTEKDLVAAARYCRTTDALGNASGLLSYGKCLQNGVGVERNLPLGSLTINFLPIWVICRQCGSALSAWNDVKWSMEI
jgi:TPR repeat protein